MKSDLCFWNNSFGFGDPKNSSSKSGAQQGDSFHGQAKAINCPVRVLPRRWNRLLFPHSYPGLPRRLRGRPGRQMLSTEPHQVRVHPGEAPPSLPLEAGEGCTVQHDTCFALLGAEFGPVDFCLCKLLEKLDWVEILVAQLISLSFACASAGVRTATTRARCLQTVVVCAHRGADITYEVPLRDHPGRHHPGSLAPRPGLHQERWIRHQRRAPLTSGFPGLQQQHGSPLQQPCGLFQRHTPDIAGAWLRRTIHEDAA